MNTSPELSASRILEAALNTLHSICHTDKAYPGMVLERMFYHAPHGYAKVTLQPLILPYNLNDAGIDTIEAIISNGK